MVCLSSHLLRSSTCTRSSMRDGPRGSCAWASQASARCSTAVAVGMASSLSTLATALATLLASVAWMQPMPPPPRGCLTYHSTPAPTSSCPQAADSGPSCATASSGLRTTAVGGSSPSQSPSSPPRPRATRLSCSRSLALTSLQISTHRSDPSARTVSSSAVQRGGSPIPYSTSFLRPHADAP